MKKVILILSGGVDSTTLLYELVNSNNYDITALSFDYGQRHKRELEMAKKTCEKLGIKHKVSCIPDLLQGSALTSDIDVPHGHYAEESMKNTVVPNRNMIMLSLAVGYAISIKAEKVFYGAHAGDHTIYPDCRPEFVNKMKEVIKLCDWHKVDLSVPYLYMDKAYIVGRGIKLGVDYKLTYTCYEGNEKPCLKCGSCTERIEAFERNGMVDPLI